MLSRELEVHPIVAALLGNRDITDIEEARKFLFDSTVDSLHDPFFLKGMTKLVARINQAKEKQEHVMVFGDYDVDGVTSSTLMRKVLEQMGIEITNHIPHRMEDGYGLNEDVAKKAHDKGVTLFITVDCGITAITEVEKINSFGIDVIIIDHHEPSIEGIPPAYAIVNPKQKDCSYPFTELATVGLVSKVIHALTGKPDLNVMDLVAIGTIADVVPLRGENRVLVKCGLPLVNKTKNYGLRALLRATKLDTKQISPFHIGFVIGPRINAAGRMDSAHEALDLFLCKDDESAERQVKILEGHNRDRQRMQQEVVQEALDIVEQEENFKDQKVIVLGKEGWHKGVIGIVASRLTDKYYRPSIVISIKDGVGTASARSIDGFHLHEAIEKCSNCLENFGGHQAAAGLTIKEENIDPFRKLINEVASKTIISKKIDPTLDIDLEIQLKHIDLDLTQIVDDMQPFGEGNPQPIFCSKRLMVRGRPQILGKGTLKFWVTDGEKSFSAVGFGMADYEKLVRDADRIDLAFNLSIDDWNKAPVPQLMIKDIKVSK